MSPASSTAPTTTAVYVALLISGAGHVIHNVAEFPITILLGWETMFPISVTVLLGVALISWPRRGSYVAAGGWALIVMIFGGGSVFQMEFLPFVPEQSISHYAAHLVYAGTQLPLLWVAYRGVTSPSTPTDDAVTG
jgi:hypothetical protein